MNRKHRIIWNRTHQINRNNIQSVIKYFIFDFKKNLAFRILTDSINTISILTYKYKNMSIGIRRQKYYVLTQLLRIILYIGCVILSICCHIIDR